MHLFTDSAFPFLSNQASEPPDDKHRHKHTAAKLSRQHPPAYAYLFVDFPYNFLRHVFLPIHSYNPYALFKPWHPIASS